MKTLWDALGSIECSGPLGRASTALPDTQGRDTADRRTDGNAPGQPSHDDATTGPGAGRAPSISSTEQAMPGFPPPLPRHRARRAQRASGPLIVPATGCSISRPPWPAILRKQGPAPGGSGWGCHKYGGAILSQQDDDRIEDIKRHRGVGRQDLASVCNGSGRLRAPA